MTPRGGDSGKILDAIKILKKYCEAKKRVISFPGRCVSGFLRDNLGDGGKRICQELHYCQEKARIRDWLEALDELTLEKAWTAEQAVDTIRDNIPDGDDLIELAKEFSEEVASEFADIVVPGALIIKAFKYGLDDLCPCCDECEGSGFIDESYCNVCGGDGFRVPFVQ